MEYAYTQQELTYALESTYPNAKVWVNFWVGQPVNENREISGPPQLVDWDEAAIGAPAPDDLDAIVASHPMPPQVPAKVSSAQGATALEDAGLYSAVEAYISAISDPSEKRKAEIAFNRATEWERTSPFLNAAADALGITQEQMDQLFIAAGGIKL